MKSVIYFLRSKLILEKEISYSSTDKASDYRHENDDS